MSPRRISNVLSLRKEREENALPFSRSPFVDPQQRGEPGEEVSIEDGCHRDGEIHYHAHYCVLWQELEVGELRVKAPAEVPWIGKYFTT